MKKTRFIAILAIVAVITAIVFIPKHMSNADSSTGITAEATNPGDDNSKGSSETKLTSESSSETNKSTERSTASTEASSTNNQNNNEETTTMTTATATTKRVVLKNELPVEELEKWFASYIEAPTTLISRADSRAETTTVTTTNNTETQTTVTTTKSTDNTETDSTKVYKDIVVKRVMVKPEKECDGLLLRDEVPEWQLIVEYREECDGVLTTKLLAAPNDYFDPLNPRYQSENWYFSTKPYVKIGEEYYKPTAVLDALIKKFRINTDDLKPYEALALIAYTPNEEENESETEGEVGMVLIDEDGNEYTVVDEDT